MAYLHTRFLWSLFLSVCCRAEVDGRIVVDILRQVITSSQLASFSLIDCVQTLLGQTLEVRRAALRRAALCCAGAGIVGALLCAAPCRRMLPCAAGDITCCRTLC